MAVSFATPTREVLEQINREPRFRDLTRIPLFAPQTLGLLAVAFGLFAATSLAYLSSSINIGLLITINSFAVYLAFTPLHDATHRAVSRNRRLNDWLGSIACLLLIPGITTRIYRYLHLEHHRFAGDKKKDPDEPFVSARGPALASVILFPDLMWLIWYLRHWTTRPASERLEFVLGALFYNGLHLGFLLSPYAWEFFVIWMIPQRLGLALVTYFFAHIQHPEGVSWEQAPFQCTVQVVTNRLLDWLMLGQTVHIVHHLFPSLPFYRYRAAWNAGLHLLERQNIPTRKFFTPSVNLVLPNNPVPATITTRVISIRSVGAAIKAYELAPVAGQTLPSFEAGAHIDVDLGNGMIRQYSLCNAATDNDRYLIAVKRESQGRGGSLIMHTMVRTGDELLISPPRNNFPLQIAAATKITLVGGGIGLTPLLAMADSLHQRGSRFALHVVARHAQAVPFGADLTTLEYSAQVSIHLDDGPAAQQFEPVAHIGRWSPGRQVYLCGPTGFMSWVVEQLTTTGWPAAAVFSETFAPRVRGNAENKPFEVQLARSGKILQVGADDSLIDVLNANDCAVICSCTQGICGSCMTPVLDGVPEHRDAILSDSERQANEVMCVCVSRARSERLILDL